MKIWYLQVFHITFHLLFNYLIAKVVFSLDVELSLIIMTGGILIDIDHILYLLYLFIWKKRSPEQMFKESFLRVRDQIPAFFIFHTFEFIITMSVIGLLFSDFLFFLSIGFLLHNLVDVSLYILRYRSHEPWIKFFFLTSYLSNRKKIEKECHVRLKKEAKLTWNTT